MVGSRSLDLVQRYADAAGAKVVLVGDNRQLSSIDAGGALRTLSRELGAQVVELTTNRRQAGVDQAWDTRGPGRLRSGASHLRSPPTPNTDGSPWPKTSKWRGPS